MRADPGRILGWIRENLVPAEAAPFVHERTDLLAEAGMDSLQIGELVDFLEREYDIVIELEMVDPANLRTVERMVALVDGILAGSANH